VDTRIGDLLDAGALREAMDGCDAVAHLAAAADVNEVEAHPAEAEELNARGTLNVLEAARAAGVGRILYASTIWVYSESAGGAVDEDSGLGLPAHLYTATKLAGEMYCHAYSRLYGVDYTILRFGIPYGPRARAAAVVPSFVTRALEGEALTIAGDGRQSRRFVFVEDLARGVVQALRPAAANRIYNLVGEEDVTIREIAGTVRDILGDVRIEHAPGRAADFQGVRVSGERAARELRWTASTPFAQGIRRYVAWRRDQPATPGPARVSLGANRWRWAARRENARALGLALLFGLVVAALSAGLAAFGSLHVTEPGDTAFTTMLLVLPPLLLVVTFDGDRRSLSTLAAVCWTLAAAEVLAVLLPWPHALARPHAVLLLFGAIASVTAAGIAGRRDAGEPVGDRR
jgi:UDP-glucose 4-epimerase